MILNLDEVNLIELVKNKDFDVYATYQGIQPYILYKMIESVAEDKAEFDMLLEKSAFEAESMR